MLEAEGSWVPEIVSKVQGVEGAHISKENKTIIQGILGQGEVLKKSVLSHSFNFLKFLFLFHNIIINYKSTFHNV